jgi:hypothetical protein
VAAPGTPIEIKRQPDLARSDSEPSSFVPLVGTSVSSKNSNPDQNTSASSSNDRLTPAFSNRGLVCRIRFQPTRILVSHPTLNRSSSSYPDPGDLFSNLLALQKLQLYLLSVPALYFATRIQFQSSIYNLLYLYRSEFYDGDVFSQTSSHRPGGALFACCYHRPYTRSRVVHAYAFYRLIYWLSISLCVNDVVVGVHVDVASSAGISDSSSC